MFVEKTKISTFSEVESVVKAASAYPDCKLSIIDANGTIADAKSILGLIGLDFSRPVRMQSENQAAVQDCLKAIA